ncbi:MAG: FAD-binding oxidoreductase, partial [Nitrospinota bacterium]
FVKTGFVRIVAPAHTEALQRNVHLLQQIGIRTSLLTAEELRALDPALRVDDVTLAAYEPDSGYADPYATALSFLNAAKRGGAVLYQGVRVTRIRVGQGRVQGVTTDKGDIDSPIVISAAGPWTRPLLQTAGIDLPLWPSRHQVAVLERPAKVRSHSTCIDGALDLYLRPESGHLTLVGTDPHQDHVDPDNYREEVDPELQTAVAMKTPRRMHQMERAAFRRGIAGVYTMSPDGKCILDRVPGVEGLFLAAGFSGTGFKISPAVGIGMAELVTQGEATSVDISPFTLSRFAEGRYLRGEYEYRDRPYERVQHGGQ